MAVGARVAIPFGQSKVNHVDLIAAFRHAHQKVVGFDVPVNKALAVHVLDTG